MVCTDTAFGNFGREWGPSGWGLRVSAAFGFYQERQDLGGLHADGRFTRGRPQAKEREGGYCSRAALGDMGVGAGNTEEEKNHQGQVKETQGQRGDAVGRRGGGESYAGSRVTSRDTARASGPRVRCSAPPRLPTERRQRPGRRRAGPRRSSPASRPRPPPPPAPVRSRRQRGRRRRKPGWRWSPAPTLGCSKPPGPDLGRLAQLCGGSTGAVRGGCAAGSPGGRGARRGEGAPEGARPGPRPQGSLRKAPSTRPNAGSRGLPT